MVRVLGRTISGGGGLSGRERHDFGKTISFSRLFCGSCGTPAGALWWLVDETHDLDGAERENPEHDVAGDLVGAAYADHAAGKIVLEVGEGALGGASLLIAYLLGRTQADPLPPPGLGADSRFAGGVSRMGLDQGNVAERAARGPDLRGVVGRIHQIVEVGHPACRHGRQRDRRLAVVQAGRGQQRGDRDVAVGHVQVQLVAVGRIDPGRLVTRRVALEETGTVLAAMDDYDTLGFTVIDRF